jgi:predicted DNA-binding protein YlxM (UPF0122 family)
MEDQRIEVARLMAELDRITDRDSQLVEDRINKLRVILEDTDKRIAVYVKELEKSRTSESLYKSLGQGIRDALETRSPERPKEHEELPDFPQDTINLSATAQSARYEQQPQNAPLRPSFSEIMEIPLPEEHPPEPVVRERQNTLPVSSPSKRQIREYIDLLINEGLSADEIASRLGISIAEVTLAMNLRRK